MASARGGVGSESLPKLTWLAGSRIVFLGQGRELCQQTAGAVPRGAVGAAPAACFGQSCLRAHPRRDRVLEERRALIAIEHRRPLPLQVPAHVVGRHAPEDMGTNPIGEPVMDGGDPGLLVAERLVGTFERIT